MKLNLNYAAPALLIFIAFIFLTSCSKDSDLLSDYVINDSEDLSKFANLVVDDIFFVSMENSTVLDVLNNDQFTDLANVSVVGTSSPENGTVVINEDNTLTYTPPEAPSESTGPSEPEEQTEEIVDTFVYMAEETGEDGTVVTEEGVVTVSGETNRTLVNLSTFGAIGDGITDDTAAIQAALDSEGNLEANSGAVFLISSTLLFDQDFEHFIAWNGATITTKSKLNPVIKINKRTSDGGLTTMRNLKVDGNDVSMRGIQIESRVKLLNVDISNLVQYISQSPAGFYVNIYNDTDAFGEWIFDGCDVNNIIGTSNNTIASDTWGSANGFLLYWRQVPSQTTTVTFKNAIIENIWGEDAGGFFPNDPTKKIGNSSSKIIVEDCIFRNAERRQLKGFCSNMEFNRVVFGDPDPNNPNIQRGTISGMVVFGSENRSNIHFDDCDFISTGYDGRVIPIGVKNFSIKNSRFRGGADIALTKEIGDGLIQNSVFESGSSIFSYGNVFFSKKLKIDRGNEAPSNYIKLSSSYYELID